MQRSLRVKRIYSLGQYQNIELQDEIVDLPDNIALNENIVGLLSYLQLLNLERKVNAYYQIREKYRELTPAEAIALIEQEIGDTKQALYAELNKPKET